jgi:hypothetical protein
MSTLPATIPVAERPWVLPSRGRVGMFCLIAGEAAIFTIFVVAYIFYIGKSLSGPMPREVLEIPIITTICLLSSSLTIHFAVRAASPDFREGTDNFDESFRHHLLLAGGAARISRDRGFGGADAGNASVSRGQGTPDGRRARGCVLVVLAFCRRGLGRGFHRSVPDWTMSETWQTKYARKPQESRVL